MFAFQLAQLRSHRQRHGQSRRHAADQRHRRRQWNRRHRRFQPGWLDHLYCACRCSHAQQHCPAHHHQRRQSCGLHRAEHLGDESHPDPHLRLADDVQSRVRRRSSSPARNSLPARRCWSNGSPVPTTFNSGNQLTATSTSSQPGNLDLQVLNPAPGPATSADLIATVNGTPPVPIVSPQDAARFLEQATFGATDADIRNVSLNGFQGWLESAIRHAGHAYWSPPSSRR